MHNLEYTTSQNINLLVDHRERRNIVAVPTQPHTVLWVHKSNRETYPQEIVENQMERHLKKAFT